MKAFEDLRIVFFGTPEFAVASLKALVDAGANIAAVVTAPDKPAGRGMQLQSSAIKEYAISGNIPVLQPEKLKNETFVKELRKCNADIQVIVAFRMLPEVVWDMPPMGTVNVHGSLLPQYRGAAPINWAIINGETETGVTTFKLQHQIDTGNILLQQQVAVHADDNAGTIHDALMAAGAQLLVKTIYGLADGTVTETPQKDIPAAALKHAPKIFKQDLQIEWNKPVAEVHNLVRGLSPNPGAHAMLEGKTFKLYKTHYILEQHIAEPGTYATDHKTYLRFAAIDGWLYADEVQQEGKKKMDVISFLRGFRA